ncbi:hypothetical protein D3C72_1824960 [compost metagenome]
MHAAAAVVVLVLRNIGQVREIAERAHHLVGLVARQALEQAVQLSAGGTVVLAAEAHRGLADGLDHLEGGVAFLFTQAFAQQAAQEADVLAQRHVLVGGAAGGGGDGGSVARHDGKLGLGGTFGPAAAGGAFRFGGGCAVCVTLGGAEGRALVFRSRGGPPAVGARSMLRHAISSFCF